MSITNYPIPLDWMDKAICKNSSSLFFPPLSERPQARKKRETEAKLICVQCPVKFECRDHARKNGEYGVWGGESEMDRERLGYLLPLKYVARARKARQLQQNNDII